LLNELVDILEKEAQAAKDDQETLLPSEKIANGPKKSGLANGAKKEPPLATWVHKNFQVIWQFNVSTLACCLQKSLE
jgi:ubiquitin carboxyl-terminal hydrolase 12/46